MQGTTIILTLAIAVAATACMATPAAPKLSAPPTTSTAGRPTEITVVGQLAEPLPGDQPETLERRREIDAETKRLWFGWYAAVAARDTDALGEVVALNRIHADGLDAITRATLRFSSAPTLERYEFEVLDVLRDEDDCVVVALREDPGAFLVDAVVAERIGVFWKHEGRWYLATSWGIDTPEFAWSDDCSLMVRQFA